MYNRVVLLGHLTRDIELRYLQNGTAIGKTAIAVTKKFTNSDGSKGEKTCFVDITFWGKTAEVANQYLRKGSKLLVEGSLEFEQWQDQNGQNRSKHSVSVESMEMLGDNTNQNNQNTNNGYNQNNQNYNNNNRANGYGGNYNNAPQNQPQAQQTQNDKYDVGEEQTIPF